MSNREISERLYLAANTVKTFIRTAYAKIGAATRSQAVIWALSHGFAPDRRDRRRASAGPGDQS